MNAEELFVRFFWPLYPADVRADLSRARAADANPAKNPSIPAHLDEAAARFAGNGRALFGADAAAIALDGTDASVHRLSAALTRGRRDAWASDGPPGTPDNALFNAIVHGAAYVGACVVARHGGIWSARRPLWESLVTLRSRAGEAELAVFQWWLKSLSDDALDATSGANATTAGSATLADRYRAHVEVPCARPEELPRFVHGDRALPRLKQPAYDRLHKYVRAHLPELGDLGADFPSPERFAAFDFRWIDFHVLGEGRMVLFAGASPSGLHLFWLGAGGFEKGAFIACEAFPAPIVRVEDDRIVCLLASSGATQTHELLWWGP